MKLPKLFLIIFIHSLFEINISYSQWVSTNGPINDTEVKAILRHDSTDYISVFGCGIFTKNINDSIWNQISHYWFDEYLLIGDSLLFTAQLESSGFFIYDDTYFADLSKGFELHETSFGFSNDNELDISKEHIYVKARDVIYRVNLDGSSSTKISQGLPTATIPYDPSLFINSFVVTDNHILCGTKIGLYISNIDSINWVKYNEGLSSEYIDIVAFNKNDYYCVIDNRLFQSDDFGDSWTLLFETNSRIIDLQIDDDALYCLTSTDGSYSSFDEGLTWNPINSNLTNLKINEITKLGNDLIYISAKNGIYTWINNSLSDLNKGLVCSNVRELEYSEDKAIALVNWKSIDIYDKNKWNDVKTPGTINRRFHLVKIGKEYIVISVKENKPSLSYSTNNGETWNYFENDPPLNDDSRYIVEIFGDTIIVGTDETNKIFYTDNFGSTWNEISVPTNFSNCTREILKYNSNIYVTGCGHREIISLNNNFEINEIAGNLPDFSVEKMVCTNDHIYAKLFDGNLYRNNLLDKIWVRIAENPNEIESIYTRINDFVTMDSILFIATNKGVYTSVDNGLNFIEYNDGLFNTNTTSISMNNDTVFVGTAGNGVWKRKISRDEFIVDHQDIVNINSYIYPNPANFFIKVKGAELNETTYTIINTYGQKEMQTISNDGIINIGSLAQGIYILNYELRGENISQKFIIQR